MPSNNLTRRTFLNTMGATAAASLMPRKAFTASSKPKNIVLIYADDLGYGDVSCYGATKFKTPNIDRLAANGLRFSNAHSSSATCTPSRYSLLTGEYAWRRKGTGVLPGNAKLIIEPGRPTLPAMMKEADYKTGVIGKWHLGLGGDSLDWNGDIKPGPLEIGFDYSFLIPATGDRVPCVFVENHRVVDLDPSDPIEVSFGKKIGNDPTGRENPELLKMRPSHGHDMTIVNGISRIGYMKGGHSARWVDEDIADVITAKANKFITNHKDEPFFLYFSTHDIHVPRVPNRRFVGQSGLGPRGDAIMQLDWSVGEIMATLDRLNLTDDTLVLFASDNGPVVDDGYQDEAVTRLNGHTPSGNLRGGKYSSFDAGTRTPFIAHWPGHIQPGESGALVSQIDLFASFASMTGENLSDNAAPDSHNIMPALLGESPNGREYLIEHAGSLSIIQDDWKFIAPSKRAKYNKNVDIELGNDPEPQLYNLKEDIGETNNVIAQHPDIAKKLSLLLDQVKANGRSRN